MPISPNASKVRLSIVFQFSGWIGSESLECSCQIRLIFFERRGSRPVVDSDQHEIIRPVEPMVSRADRANAATSKVPLNGIAEISSN